ncbi:MAG: flagellar hook-basal body protein [Nitrospiraceae bacterium]
MNRGIYPILSGALAQEQRTQVFAHNIANVNTKGFKQEEPLFQALLPHRRLVPSPESQIRLVSGMTQPVGGAAERVFVGPHGNHTQFDSGRLRTTGNPLDLAIDGSGFFEVRTPEGFRYTRNGVFHLDEKRRLVTQAGFPVMGTKGELKLPPGEVVIDGRGAISVGGQPVGTVKVVEFPEQRMPHKVAESLFAGEGGADQKLPTIMSAAVEESNVNPLSEMVKLIQGMRSYESAQKMIQTIDRMAELAVQDVGRVG